MAFATHRRVLFVSPTGSGKTVIFAYITTNAVARGNGVIILAHRVEIVDQISAALSGLDVRHGRVQPGYSMTGHPVQVGMVQSVAKRLESIDEPSLLIVDEAHHAVAGTWSKVAMAWPRAKILGVTATPERLDGVGLRDAFDILVMGPDVDQLIVEGYLAPFRYLAPTTAIDMNGVRSTAGDYNSRDLERAVDQRAITGDVIGHYLAHVAPRTAIAFCVTVEHAEHVAQQFRDNGIAAASIDGSMRPEVRRNIVDRLRDGDLRVLTSCEVISEGFDCPAVGGAILLRPTQSFGLHRQQVGRCLRPKQDGSAAIIADHVGNVFRHGLPNAPYVWSLDSSKHTHADYANARAGVRRCRACGEVFGAGLMDYAGGDLHRLREIQVARGYKRGWVHFAAQDAAAKARVS